MKTNDIHIELPSSKSISNRWLVLNHISGYPFVLRNLSTADDTQLLQTLLGQLRRGTTTHFHCHNAGTVARFLLALLAVTPGQWSLSGDERLKQRPFGPLINSLRSMGCNIRCTEQEGCLPVSIEGYLPQRKMVDIDPSASSQFVSAMLLVGPLLPQGLTLTLTDRAASRPYIDMTLAVLNQAGIETSVSANLRVYRVAPLPSGGLKKNLAVSIERGDAGALAAEDGEDATVRRGDDLFHPITGLDIAGRGAGLDGRTADRSRGGVFHVHLPEQLARDGCLERQRARMRGIKNLRLKESDRIDALQKELKAFGADITLTATELRLPSSRLHGATTVCSHSDHRIAMAFGILTLLFPDLVVQDPEQVTKSFPDFWQQLDTIRKASAQHQAIG